MKRLMDVGFSSLGILLLAPLFLGAATCIWVTDGRPIFFRQQRVGLRGQSFQILKFRTMVRDAERLGASLTVGKDPRVTAIGHWLRKTKLDELPQLFNVLKGEMSLVGPRPEVPHYVRQYQEEQKAVLELKPGITDPASLCFINESELLAETANPEEFYVSEVMPEKIRINLEYAERANAVADFGVILETIKRLAA